MDMMAAAELVSVAQMRAYVAQRPAWAGVGQVRRALPLASEHSRSPNETRLRLLWVDAGLPTPLVNQVYDRDGRLLGIAPTCSTRSPAWSASTTARSIAARSGTAGTWPARTRSVAPGWSTSPWSGRTCGRRAGSSTGSWPSGARTMAARGPACLDDPAARVAHPDLPARRDEPRRAARLPSVAGRGSHGLTLRSPVAIVREQVAVRAGENSHLLTNYLSQPARVSAGREEDRALGQVAEQGLGLVHGDQVQHDLLAVERPSRTRNRSANVPPCPTASPEARRTRGSTLSEACSSLSKCMPTVSPRSRCIASTRPDRGRPGSRGPRRRPGPPRPRSPCSAPRRRSRRRTSIADTGSPASSASAAVPSVASSRLSAEPVTTDAADET